MAARVPLVSVGVPVYNGEKHLRATLDALLSQSHADLELIISDNASTDTTWEICSSYARRDARVCAFHQDHNGGVAANWNFVARASRGRYFKWASASDTCAPRFIEHCVASLEAEPDLALCYPRTEFVSSNGTKLGVCEADLEVMSGRPEVRFAQVSSRMTVNNAQSGVIRREMLMKTRLERRYPHGDLVLMAELALLGKFRLLPEVLLYRLADPEHWTGQRTPLELERMFEPNATRPRHLLRTRRQLDYFASSIVAPVPIAARARAAWFALRHLYWSRNDVTSELRALFASGQRAASL